MKSRLVLCAALAAALLCGGCMNLYTRAPWTTSTRVERCYQSSGWVAGVGIVCMFPQMMSDCPGHGGFQVENLLTIPLGLLVECEAVVEAAVDTVCLPFDWPVSAYRRKREEEEEERRLVDEE